MRKFFYVAFWVGLCFFAACTSSPSLETYPERQIDRPYTLPDDVATWTTAVGASVVDDGQSNISAAINPLIFEQALTDSLTLEYAPIPLGLRYQIANTEQNIWGVSLRTGIGYSSFSGVLFEPTLGFYHRYRPGGSFAWESFAAYSHEFSDRPIEAETAILSTGPMFQLTDTMVLTPKIGFGVTRNELAQFEEYFGVRFNVDEFLFSVPASGGFRWLFHRQWEYGASYRLNSLIIEESRLVVHSLNMSMTHFW